MLLLFLGHSTLLIVLAFAISVCARSPRFTGQDIISAFSRASFVNFDVKAQMSEKAAKRIKDFQSKSRANLECFICGAKVRRHALLPMQTPITGEGANGFTCDCDEPPASCLQGAPTLVLDKSSDLAVFCCVTCSAVWYVGCQRETARRVKSDLSSG